MSVGGNVCEALLLDFLGARRIALHTDTTNLMHQLVHVMFEGHPLENCFYP